MTPSKNDPLLTPDEATDHIRGRASARVTLLEYGDFECPACRDAHAALAAMLPKFGGEVRLVFRHFPLREKHPHAELAAEAAETAGAQGRFWQMHDRLFDRQQHLDEKHILECASRIGLDLARYHNEMSDHVYLQRVQEHIDSGDHLGVQSTPAFFVNGERVDTEGGMNRLQQAIERILAA